MSRDFPALVNYWRSAHARRGFQGTWPVARLERLRGLLASDAGEVTFAARFGIDDSGYAFVDLSVQAELTLTCQRTLEPFGFPIELEVRLGLIASEADAAALPEGYEPLVAREEPSPLMDLVEDELILALPLIAKKPVGPEEPAFVFETEPAPESSASPFEALEALKSNKQNS